MAYILITYQIEVRTKFIFNFNVHIEIHFMRTAFLLEKDYHMLRRFKNKKTLKEN